MQKNNESRITNHESFSRITLLIASFCFAVSSGFLTGRLLLNHESQITMYPDTRPPIPTIHIRGIQNGLLHGKIIGNARVVFQQTVLTQSGIFAIDSSPLLRNEISVVVPAWAQFVASKKGKKYYPVFSAAGQRIAPANRVYFRTEEEAMRAGYDD